MKQFKFVQSVSIQPKPKKGLVAIVGGALHAATYCFNPAEAEEGFSQKYSNVGEA